MGIHRLRRAAGQRRATVLLCFALLAGACAADEPDITEGPAAVGEAPDSEAQAVADTAADEPAPGPPASSIPDTPAVHSATPGLRIHLESRRCPAELGSELRRRADCQIAHLPANRTTPGNRGSVQITVALIEAEKDSGKSPVVYIDGGPGAPTIEMLADSWSNLPFADIGATRDVVIFDARGVGLSTPSIHCAAFERILRRAASLDHQGVVDNLERCIEELDEDGVDPQSFSATAMADDVEDLRRLLGIDSWVLYGVSYGTKVALISADRHPHGVEGLILDSVVSADAAITDEGALAGAIAVLNDRCAADRACRREYGDLEATFARILDLYREEPLPVEGRYATLINDEIVQTVIASSLYDPVSAGRLPHLMARLEERGPGVGSSFSLLLQPDNAVMALAQLVVMCNSDVPLAERTPDSDIPLGYLPGISFPFSDLAPAYCSALGIEALAPGEGGPRVPRVPTLVLGGQLDPITPTRWGRAVATQAPLGRFIEFPNQGHAVTSSSSCAATIVSEFLERPLQPIDTSCIAWSPDLDFNVTTPGRTETASALDRHQITLPTGPGQDDLTIGYSLPDGWFSMGANSDGSQVEAGESPEGLLLLDDPDLPGIIISLVVTTSQPEKPLGTALGVPAFSLEPGPELADADEVVVYRTDQFAGLPLQVIGVRRGEIVFIAAVFSGNSEDIPDSAIAFLESLEVLP